MDKKPEDTLGKILLEITYLTVVRDPFSIIKRVKEVDQWLG